MKIVVIGGHSRSVGKTGVAAALIANTREREWTALKLTQYGHGICSASGQPCGCALEDPECPYVISRELDPQGTSDTARLLRAGAREAYWLRAPMGRLDLVMPELQRLLDGRENVLFESNSILDFYEPALYVPVLRYDVADFKESNRRFLKRADAFVVVSSGTSAPHWPDIDEAVLTGKPRFQAQAPGFDCPELTALCERRLAA